MRSRQAAPPSSPLTAGRLQGPGHGQDLGQVGEPLPQQPLEGRHRPQPGRLGDPAGEPAADVVAAGHGHQQAGPVLEVHVDQLAGHAGDGGHVGHGDGLDPALADQLPGGV
jgi:hypothetical protein